MDIAALSMGMSQVSTKQAAGLQVLNIAKGVAETTGANLVQMLQPSPHPTLGSTLDITV